MIRKAGLPCGGTLGMTSWRRPQRDAGLRLAVNTSPEPVTNIGASVLEDVTVLGVVLLLDNSTAVTQTLSNWDSAHISDPNEAGDEAFLAAQAIHDYLWSSTDGQISTAYTQAKYVVLVGDDAILPALRVADHVHVLSRGRVVHGGPPDALWRNEEIKSRYLGL